MRNQQIFKKQLIFLAGAIIFIVYVWSKQKFNKRTISTTRITEKPKTKVEKNFNQKDVEAVEAVWNYVYDKKYTCTEEEYVGGPLGVDGAYYVCKEKKFWPFPQLVHEDPCLVYSFGIGDDFKFDDAMAYAGCEVHAFDPSMNLYDEEIRKSGVIFHKIGIDIKDSDDGVNGWKMRTLKTLMKELGHENRALDYLKVDTDKGDGTGFENIVMRELLATGLHQCVRQYAMEIHFYISLHQPALMKLCREISQQLIDIRKEGFHLYQTVENMRGLQQLNPHATSQGLKASQLNGNTVGALWETHFVNLKFKGKCNQVIRS